MESISLNGAQSMGPRPSICKISVLADMCAKFQLTSKNVKRQAEQCFLLTDPVLNDHTWDTNDVDCRGCIHDESESSQLMWRRRRRQQAYVYQLITAAIKILRPSGQSCTLLFA
jgi:hypothetical protein